MPLGAWGFLRRVGGRDEFHVDRETEPCLITLRTLMSCSATSRIRPVRSVRPSSVRQLHSLPAAVRHSRRGSAPHIRPSRARYVRRDSTPRTRPSRVRHVRRGSAPRARHSRIRCARRDSAPRVRPSRIRCARRDSAPRVPIPCSRMHSPARPRRRRRSVPPEANGCRQQRGHDPAARLPREQQRHEREHDCRERTGQHPARRQQKMRQKDRSRKSTCAVCQLSHARSPLYLWGHYKQKRRPEQVPPPNFVAFTAASRPSARRRGRGSAGDARSGRHRRRSWR